MDLIGTAPFVFRAVAIKRFAVLIRLMLAGPVNACTIFVLTDGEHVLFYNNEDWENFHTRVWFVPEGPSRSGCVCVGFDNGWAQGGMNTTGLAFDWVAGYKERWQRDPTMKSVAGNPCELMLATCRTVDEAVAFFREHWEPSFPYAKVLVADRTGASVRIGAHDGACRSNGTTDVAASVSSGEASRHSFRIPKATAAGVPTGTKTGIIESNTSKNPASSR